MGEESIKDDPIPVWPFGPPPVCTSRWDDDARQKFTDRFRPADYRGGRNDRVAWEEYLRAHKLR